MHISAQLKGFLALLTCAVLFASFSVWVRWLGTELTAYQQIGFRNSIALVLAIGAIWLSKQNFRSLQLVQPWVVLAYTLSFPLAVVFYTLAVLQIPIITTLFGLYSGALVGSLLISTVIFKEVFTLPKIISSALALMGLMIFAYPFDERIVSLGFGLAILSGVFDASANGFRKFLAGKVDRFVLVVLQMVGGLVVAGGLMRVFGQWQLPSISTTAWIIGLIFGISLVAISYLMLVGFSNFDLNLGTVVLSSELFFAAILGWTLFQETVTLSQFLGSICILVATLLTNLSPTDWQHWGRKLRFAAGVNKISQRS